MLRTDWSGAEWQTHCRKLLAMKYGEDVQFIPDRDRGDGGLEAYRLDRAVAYQCYAAQEAFDVASLTEAQKGKIRTDIAALTKHPARTARLLGSDQRLERWVLLTPYYDSKEMVFYSRYKSDKIKKQSPCPDWCDSSCFEIVVHSDELFAAELSRLYGPDHGRLHLDLGLPSQDEVEREAGTDSATVLRGKLSVDPVLSSDPGFMEQYLRELLLDFVRGNRQKRILQNGYATSYLEIKRQSDSILRALTRIMAGTSGSGPEAVEALTKRLAENFEKVAPGFSEALCEDLARYFVAAWFIDCPLRLRSTQNSLRTSA
jgi:hypothetical protein